MEAYELIHHMLNSRSHFMKIKLSESHFTSKQIFHLKEDDLWYFHDDASVNERFYLSFILKTSALQFLEKKDNVAAARTYYLLTYYLFHVLTPPGSIELSEYYIREAIKLAPSNEEYQAMLNFILEKGN